MSTSLVEYFIEDLPIHSMAVHHLSMHTESSTYCIHLYSSYQIYFVFLKGKLELKCPFTFCRLCDFNIDLFSWCSKLENNEVISVLFFIESHLDGTGPRIDPIPFGHCSVPSKQNPKNSKVFYRKSVIEVLNEKNISP